MVKINILFVLPPGACPYCDMASLAIQTVNLTLPIGEKIRIINVLSGDSRVNILKRLYNVDDIYQLEVPVLIIRNQIIKTKFGKLDKGYGEDLAVKSVFDQESYVTFLKTYLIGG